MNKKLVGILTCTLLIITSVLPVMGTKETNSSSFIYEQDLTVSTNRLVYSLEEEMAITVKNTGKDSIHFSVFPKIEIFDEDENKIFPSYIEQGSWTLRPGESETYIWDQKDLDGNTAEPGDYMIKTVSDLPMEAVAIPVLYDRGYVILVAGDLNSHDHRCYDGPREIYDDLIDIGYTDERIQFLNEENNGIDPKVDAIASEATVEAAIKEWALTRVNWYSPLYIIMFDHGGTNSFSVVNSAGGGNHVSASDLRSWIDYLYSLTRAHVNVWIMSCKSGSFIDELSRNENITITSTCAGINNPAGPSPYYEHFTRYFWPKIVCGYTWGEAFNYACYHGHQAHHRSLAQLDDNGDGDGHGVYDCSETYQGDLPHHGDGNYSMNHYMGLFRRRCMARIVWWKLIISSISHHKDKQNLETIPIWAVIGDKDSVSSANVGVLDPNWECTECLEDMPYEYFEMNDNDNDGRWTVEIPVEEFTKYEATDFTLLITAKGKEGETSIPLKTSVYLREPPRDDVMPFVNIDNPRDGQVVGGTLNIKGRASDNMELKTITVYLGNYKEEIIPQSSSHYYFEVPLDLVQFPEGKTTLQVVVTDASGNIYTHVREVIIVGSPSKPDTPSGPRQGKTGTILTYSTVTTDPQGDKVWYMFDWDDGTTTDWLGPFESDVTCESSHDWNGCSKILPISN